MLLTIAKASKQDRDSEAYRLREWLWANSFRPRGQGCGRDVLGGSVFLEFGGGESRYQGLATCGSVWSCPVCAPKIGAGRMAEVQDAMRWARANGLHVVLLTSTVRHGRDDGLLQLRRQLSDAWRRLRQNRAWRESYAPIIEGSIKATEVTHGEANGWHPHAHSILFVRARSGAVARSVMASASKLWCDAVAAAGGNSLEGPGWDVRLIEPADDEWIAGYVAKFGRPPVVEQERSAAFELTLGASKRAGKGRSWVQILEAAVAGDLRSAVLFGEYELAMVGVQALVFSNGLKKAVGLVEKSDDQLEHEANERERAAMVVEGVACIPRDVWKRLVRERITYYLLEAGRSGPDAIAGFFLAFYGKDLDDLGVTLEWGDPF